MVEKRTLLVMLMVRMLAASLSRAPSSTSLSGASWTELLAWYAAISSSRAFRRASATWIFRSYLRFSSAHASLSLAHWSCSRSDSSSRLRSFFCAASSLFLVSEAVSTASSRSRASSPSAEEVPPSRRASWRFRDRFSLAVVSRVPCRVSDSSRLECRWDSRSSMILVFSSWSRRRFRISETRFACRVGVNRRGSRMLMFSSWLASLEDRLDPLSLGMGGGDELGAGGVTDRRDDLREVRDGVLYGVSAGVGSATTDGETDSSSVSQTFILSARSTGPQS
ncbi:hypothetical protein VTK73DRAFT_10065 [Phialemonium thermophilum]|uniref:Secreted protein n=1 Tax=Phialemonium thermophilum TaxID=223376 RepID=A0ABR3VYR8_9PEZI